MPKLPVCILSLLIILINYGGMHEIPISSLFWYSLYRQITMPIWRHMETQNCVNIGSGNGLLPDGTNPIPEPMLSNNQSSPVTVTWGQLHKRFPNHQSIKLDWKWLNTLNSLMPSDVIWWHRSGSTLAQVMACCLTAPSHYLNQRWLIISNVLWHSSEGNFIRDTLATIR